MSAYRTVVVGTDGSESSFLAVEKAAAIAGDAGAKLIIACAYYPADPKDVGQAADALGDEAYQITGSAPTYDILRTAKERAHAAGAKEVVERAVVGAPGRVAAEPGRRGRCRSSGDRQPRTQHAHRASPRVRSVGCRPQVDVRRPDRPHGALRPETDQQ